MREARNDMWPFLKVVTTGVVFVSSLKQCLVHSLCQFKKIDIFTTYYFLYYYFVKEQFIFLKTV